MFNDWLRKQPTQYSRNGYIYRMLQEAYNADRKEEAKMRMVYIEEEEEVIKFAIRAAKKFSKDPILVSYTDDKIKSGCLFALKWGLIEDCVLVFKLDDNFMPVKYHHLIKEVT